MEIVNEAHQILRSVVSKVPAESWEAPTPCAQWTVTQVLQHAVGDQLAYASKLTGIPGPIQDPFQPSGRLDQTPLELLEPVLEVTASAWATVDPDAAEVPVPLPPFTVAASVGAAACALDAAVHAWDIAIATGQPSPLTPALAAQLIPAAQALVEPLRAYGMYGPALTPEPDADEATILLNYLGRKA